ncbi:MAG: TolC family protein [Elusimicrobia bacterium]|nr:TolC family protein [Elusimicrobiota bacterium]
MKIFVILAVVLNSVPAFGEGIPVIKLPLETAQQLALAYSPELKGLQADEIALSKRADERLAAGRPSLDFDASYSRMTEVSRLSLPVPGNRSIQFGDYYAYTLGPSFNWMFWDFGSTRSSYESANSLALSKASDISGLKSRIVLESRLAYFKIKLALDQAVLIGESRRLSEAQYKDIKLRYDAGAANRMDMLSSRAELLTRAMQFTQARSELAGAARDFFYQAGIEKKADLSYPADSRLKALLAKDEPPPTVIIEMDATEKLMLSMSAQAPSGPSAAHPALRALSEAGRSYEQARKALEAGRYPRFQLFAKSYLAYPNGAILKQYSQNILGVGLNLPVFEGWRLTREIEARSADIDSVKARKDRAADGLSLSWEKAQDQLSSLKAQASINADTLNTAAELETLTYESYQAGRSTFLEVQNANLKELDAKIQAARTDIQMLNQLAYMADLSVSEN